MAIGYFRTISYSQSYNWQGEFNIIEPGIQTYDGIIGQEDLVARLKDFGEFCASRDSTPGHILLIGERGMGKDTIASAFASETGRALEKADAADLENKGDFTLCIMNLPQNSVLLLSNIQLLRPNIVNVLRALLRNSRLEVIVGQGASAKRHTFDVHPFTLIATCAKRADCAAELLSEFALTLTLKTYSALELSAIVRGIAEKGGISLEEGAAELIARCCEPRPCCLESTLQRLVRAVNKKALTGDDVQQAFRVFGINVHLNGSAIAVSNLKGISGVDFEKLVVKLLEKMGFHAEMTKASGDGGIDIDATLDKPIVGGRYLFQCKRFAPDNLIGAPTLRDFYGAVTAERAVKGVFITTSDFTTQAREFGEKARLELINQTQLQQLLVEFGLSVA